MVLKWVLGNTGKRKKSGKKAAPKPSYEDAKRIAACDDAEARAQLAAHEDLEPEFLYFFASDDSPEVRRAVATNQGTPLQADRILANDADAGVRYQLARKIGRLVPTLNRDETDRLTVMAMEVLQILAHDDLPRVRATIAEEIKRADNVPSQVVRELARDVEGIVAAPILEYSPMLSDDDLLDIIAGGCASGALVALSRRQNLGEKVAAAVASTGDVQAVSALLTNRTAGLSEKTLDMIAVKAEDEVEWHAPMVDRDNLPARVVRRIATFVSSALMDMLIAKHRDQADLVDELRQTVRKRIERGDFAGDDPDWQPAEDRALQLFKAGELDEAIFVRAIEQGDNAFARHAMACLSGLPLETVTRMLNTGSGKAVTALTWKAGLTMRTALLVQRKLSRVPAKSQVHPGPGDTFPMSNDELNWYIECVGG